jgi:hypothetical protein
MGAVYEATHARLAGRYAIKVLLREYSDDPEVRARFEREARITSLLQHPNIVQVIDHNSTADGTSYLVMEFLSGDSLAARLAREGRQTPPAVADVVDQIAAGLAAAHACGIVHRDLKPDTSSWCRRGPRQRADQDPGFWYLEGERGPRRRRSGSSAARRSTWRPSRPRGAPATSTPRPISTRWPSSRTRC